MHALFKGEVANLGAAAGVGMSITMQGKAPLLLGPGPRQRADQLGEGEIVGRAAREQGRHDPG
jgi:hypothetical protein